MFALIFFAELLLAAALGVLRAVGVIVLFLLGYINAQIALRLIGAAP